MLIVVEEVSGALKERRALMRWIDGLSIDTRGKQRVSRLPIAARQLARVIVESMCRNGLDALDTSLLERRFAPSVIYSYSYRVRLMMLLDALLESEGYAPSRRHVATQRLLWLDAQKHVLSALLGDEDNRARASARELTTEVMDAAADVVLQLAHAAQHASRARPHSSLI